MSKVVKNKDVDQFKSDADYIIKKLSQKGIVIRVGYLAMLYNKNNGDEVVSLPLEVVYPNKNMRLINIELIHTNIIYSDFGNTVGDEKHYNVAVWDITNGDKDGRVWLKQGRWKSAMTKWILSRA